MPLTKFKSIFQFAGAFASLTFILLSSGHARADSDFSMKIMDAFAITGRGTVLTGQVATGSLEVGDPVCIPLNNGEIAARGVEGIEKFGKVLDRAEKGQIVGLLVEVDKKLVEKGSFMHSDCELDNRSD